MSDIIENGLEDESLYPSSILEDLPGTIEGIRLAPPVSIKEPGENLKIRPLRLGDYDRGYLDLLSQLTKVGSYSRKLFHDTFYSMKNCKNTYFITVIEDISLGKVIGTASLVIERKFIRNCGLRGRLEDVVVNDDYRGKQLGKLIITTIRLLAVHTGCYKLTLDCKDEMIGFYKNMGFTREEGNSTTMTLRMKDMS